MRRSLASLRSAFEAEQDAGQPDAGQPADTGGGADERGVVPVDVLDRLLATPLVRPDAVARGRTRLASGELSADDLAGKVIGRLVCDRLR